MTSLAGEGVRYGEMTHPVWMGAPYGMIVEAGAFDEALATDPHMVALVNHRGTPFGSTHSDPVALMQLTNSSESLAWTLEIDPDSALAVQVERLVSTGVLTGSSAGFFIRDGEWQTRVVDGEEEEYFLVTRGWLDGGDMSVVTHPGNPNSRTTAMSTGRVRHGLEMIS